MNPLCNAADLLPLKPSAFSVPPLFTHRKTYFAQSLNNVKPRISLTVTPSLPNVKVCPWRVKASAAEGSASAATSEIDMVKNKEGVYAPKQKKVVVLWDLDNKPPRGPPYQAAVALKKVAQYFGDVVDMSAYANRHAFVHLPNWVIEERRERRRLQVMERKGLITPTEPYVCGVCGRKCRTNLDLKKHFKQLHERERQKKLNRMRSLKGRKRQRYKERFITGNQKYEEAARDLITPKVGFGLASELRRAGVFVKTVEDKPQAADWALKRQMQHSMSRGVDWLFLVSDDSDFSEMLLRARESNLGTVVVGDRDRALGRHADLWVPWNGVENGEIAEKDLTPRSNRKGEFFDDDGDGDVLFSVSHFDGEIDGVSNLYSVVDELAGIRSDINGLRISIFSEGEEDEVDYAVDDDDDDGDLLMESEDEEEAGGNWYF